MTIVLPNTDSATTPGASFTIRSLQLPLSSASNSKESCQAPSNNCSGAFSLVMARSSGGTTKNRKLLLGARPRSRVCSDDSIAAKERPDRDYNCLKRFLADHYAWWLHVPISASFYGQIVSPVQPGHVKILQEQRAGESQSKVHAWGCLPGIPSVQFCSVVRKIYDRKTCASITENLQAAESHWITWLGAHGVKRQ